MRTEEGGERERERERAERARVRPDKSGTCSRLAIRSTEIRSARRSFIR